MAVKATTVSVNVCILRFARAFDGVVQGSGAVQYKCKGAATERITTSVTFRISAKAECDDVGTRVPATGLRGKGTTVRRDDGFAHFAGRAEIIDARKDPEVVLFKGRLELIAAVGSHPDLGEVCAPAQHVEGWFSGKGQGALAKMTLRLILAGGGNLAEGTNGFADASKNRIIGTLVIAP